MHQRTNWFHPASTRRHWFFPWSFAWHDVTSESTRHEHSHAIAIATLTFWKYLEMISSPQLQLKTNPTCPTEFTVAITAPTVDLSVVHQRCKASGLAIRPLWCLSVSGCTSRCDIFLVSFLRTRASPIFSVFLPWSDCCHPLPQVDRFWPPCSRINRKRRPGSWQLSNWVLKLALWEQRKPGNLGWKSTDSTSNSGTWNSRKIACRIQKPVNSSTRIGYTQQPSRGWNYPKRWTPTVAGEWIPQKDGVYGI